MTGVLQEFRIREIEALLEGIESPGLYTTISGERYLNKNALNQALSGTTLSRPAALALGVRSVALAAQLRELLNRDSLSLAEANAYFGGIFGYSQLFAALPTTRSQEEAQKTQVEVQAEGRTAADVASSIQEEFAAIQGGAASGGAQAVSLNVDEMPVAYQPDGVGRVVRNLADEVELRLAEIKAGKINFPPGSIDGGILRPGTVPTTSLRADELSRRVQQWPTSEQAIKIRLQHDSSVDRWHTPGGLVFPGGTRVVTGPGRVWRTRAIRWPTAYRRPTGGPMRYRLVQPGMRLGLMSITRLIGSNVAPSSTSATYQLSYGLVVRGIPYFGDEPPSQISAIWVGRPPSQLHVELNNYTHVTNTPDLYWGPSREIWNAGSDQYVEPFADLSKNIYEPSSNECRRMSGFRFGLITGETWQDVFPQLNGKPSHYGYLSGRARSPLAWAGGRESEQDTHYDAPCSASTVEATSGTAANAQYRTDAFVDSRRVINGVPFRPADCEALKPDRTAKTFSVWIEAMLDRYVDGADIAGWQSGASDDMKPAAWWTTGVQVAPAETRQTFVDIVVY